MPGKRGSRGGYARRRSGPRTRTEWTSTSLDEQNIAIGAQDVTDLLGGLTVSDKQRVGTVLRIVGDFIYHNTTLNAQTFGRWGIHVVTDDAMTAGALPDPSGDFRGAWMWNSHFYIDRSVAGDSVHERFDIRSKRIIPSLSTLAWILEIGSAANGAMDYSWTARLLYSVK